jgi:hypothetical protein
MGVERAAQSDRAAMAIAQSIEQVERAISTAASVSQENGAAAEEVSASMIEVTLQATRVAQDAEAIKQISQDLHDASLLFHWIYNDDRLAGKMQPEQKSPPWHSDSRTQEEATSTLNRSAAWPPPHASTQGIPRITPRSFLLHWEPPVRHGAGPGLPLSPQAFTAGPAATHEGCEGHRRWRGFCQRQSVHETRMARRLRACQARRAAGSQRRQAASSPELKPGVFAALF